MILRSLKYFWRIHLAVIAGAAVTTAVLTGALLVGDSVRGSLRSLVLERLGKIDSALISEKFFREDLSHDLNAVPAITASATAVAENSGARATGITVHGIDGRMNEFYDANTIPQLLIKPAGQIFQSV